MRYQILIAGPDGCYPGMSIDENAETAAFFSSERAECFSSMDPEDVGRCDGMVIPGGLPDVSPAYWGEENTACHLPIRGLAVAPGAARRASLQAS